VAPHKRIRAVRLADQIPRTPSGKILRRVLIDEDRA
jgi:acyl-coenzyme A synthetase/AMP-(fatty) acid ligase